jgi:DNA-binding YbaB/EbfC family protein
MFGNLLGDMEERQKEMRQQLAVQTIATEAGDGAVKVTANGNKEITDITINPEKLDMNDLDQLQDLLMVAINRAIDEATQMEAEASQKLIQNMMPPGMGGLSDLFG